MGKKSLDHDDVSIWKKVAETVTPILRQRFGEAGLRPTEIKDGSGHSPKSPLKAKAQPSPDAVKKQPERVISSPKPKQGLSPADLDQIG